MGIGLVYNLVCWLVVGAEPYTACLGQSSSQAGVESTSKSQARCAHAKTGEGPSLGAAVAGELPVVLGLGPWDLLLLGVPLALLVQPVQLLALGVVLEVAGVGWGLELERLEEGELAAVACACTRVESSRSTHALSRMEPHGAAWSRMERPCNRMGCCQAQHQLHNQASNQLKQEHSRRGRDRDGARAADGAGAGREDRAAGRPGGAQVLQQAAIIVVQIVVLVIVIH